MNIELIKEYAKNSQLISKSNKEKIEIAEEIDGNFYHILSLHKIVNRMILRKTNDKEIKDTYKELKKYLNNEIQDNEKFLTSPRLMLKWCYEVDRFFTISLLEVKPDAFDIEKEQNKNVLFAHSLKDTNLTIKERMEKLKEFQMENSLQVKYIENKK